MLIDRNQVLSNKISVTAESLNMMYFKNFKPAYILIMFVTQKLIILHKVVLY